MSSSNNNEGKKGCKKHTPILQRGCFECAKSVADEGARKLREQADNFSPPPQQEVNYMHVVPNSRKGSHICEEGSEHTKFCNKCRKDYCGFCSKECPLHKGSQEGDWEERFDKMISDRLGGYGDQILYREKDIKSFIKSEKEKSYREGMNVLGKKGYGQKMYEIGRKDGIAQEAMNCHDHLLEEHEEELGEGFKVGREKTLQEIIGIVEGMKKEEPKKCACAGNVRCVWHIQYGGCNSILDKLLTFLKDLLAKGK